MKKNRIFVCCLCIILFALQVSASAQGIAEDQTEKGQFCIGLTLYSTQNEYTKRFANAAQQQAAQMGIDLLLYDGDYDASRQNMQIEEMVRNQVDGILIIPQDAEACAEGIEIASAKGVPVISVNTRADSSQIISHVGSDDVKAGEMVAKSVADVLQGSGNVVILEGPIGQSAQVERLEGMKHILAEYPDLHVIGNKTANWSRLEAKNIMKKWLETFDQIDAVIAENDDMALGALDAIEETQKDIYVVGIDGSKEGLQAVEEGRMYMTVFQNAEEQSQKALEVMVQYLRGETVEETYWIPLEEVRESGTQKSVKN